MLLPCFFLLGERVHYSFRGKGVCPPVPSRQDPWAPRPVGELGRVSSDVAPGPSSFSPKVQPRPSGGNGLVPTTLARNRGFGDHAHPGPAEAQARPLGPVPNCPAAKQGRKTSCISWVGGAKNIHGSSGEGPAALENLIARPRLGPSGRPGVEGSPLRLGRIFQVCPRPAGSGSRAPGFPACSRVERGLGQGPGVAGPSDQPGVLPVFQAAAGVGDLRGRVRRAGSGGWAGLETAAWASGNMPLVRACHG